MRNRLGGSIQLIDTKCRQPNDTVNGKSRGKPSASPDTRLSDTGRDVSPYQGVPLLRGGPDTRRGPRRLARRSVAGERTAEGHEGRRKPMSARQPTVTMGHDFGRATSECKALAVARPERGLSFPSQPREGETMTVPKVSQQRITEAIDVVQWTARSDDIEAAAETRRRARQCGPDSVAFLHFVVRTDKFASSAQRVRSAIVLLEVGEFLAPETKATGLFREAEEADGPTGAKRVEGKSWRGARNGSDRSRLPLLNQWMDPAVSFWSAFDPVAGSAMSGLMRKRRGVRARPSGQLVCVQEETQSPSR